MDDADVEAVDQHQDGGSGVGSADADVVQPARVAEGQCAAGIDDVAADPGLRFSFCCGWWAGFGSGLVGGGWGEPVQGAVWPALVVVGNEGVAEGLQLGDGLGLTRLSGEPLFEGLVEAFDAPMFVKLLRGRLVAMAWPVPGVGGCCRSRGRCSA